MINFNNTQGFIAIDRLTIIRKASLEFCKTEENDNVYTRLRSSDFANRADMTEENELTKRVDAVLATLTQDAEAKVIAQLIETVREERVKVEELRKMGRGMLAMVEGLSKARQERLHVHHMKSRLDLLDRYMVHTTHLLDFRHDAELPAMPAAGEVRELGGVSTNTHGLKWESEQALDSMLAALDGWMKLANGFVFPNTNADALVDACNDLSNQHAATGTPWLQSAGDMRRTLTALMNTMTPELVSRKQVGKEWEVDAKKNKALNALLALVELNDEDAKELADWKKLVKQWNKARAALAQG